MASRIESRWTAFAGVALLLLALAAPAAAQLQTGDLYGKVVDEKGQALPGATVTVTGIGAPKIERSGADGQFHFLGLYPGTYAIKVELEGFSPLEKSDIEVRLGGNVNLVMTLNTRLSETINVTAERPILDERKVNRGVSLPASDLNKVPTARDPWSLLQKAPGVQTDRINVGGNESGQQSDFLGVGANARDNTFAVDGVILTDMNAVGGSTTYYDFGAFEEVQLTVSSADVTIATSGVTINQVTKRGGNVWKANARYLRTDGSLQARPFLANGNKIKSVAEYGGDVGGPIIKDMLWAWVSEGRSDIKNIAQGVGSAAGQLDATNLKDFNSKLNFQLGQSNSGVLHFWKNNKLKNGRGAGPTHAPESTLDQTTPSNIYKVEDTHIFSPAFLLTALGSRDDGGFTLTPKGGLNAFIFRDDAGVLRGSNSDFKQQARIQQERLDGNYFFNAGKTSNELKFGGSYRQQDNRSNTVWPGGAIVQSCAFAGCVNPAPDQVVVEFPRNRKVNMSSSYGSAWIQDTLTVDRFTLNAGVRYDDQRLKNRPASDAGNPLAQGLLPAINFPGNNDGGYRWRTFVPRVSATYALGPERRTLLRGSFSQYAEQLGQIPLGTRVNPIGYSYAYFYFIDANHNFRLDPSEVGSLVYLSTYNINTQNPGSTVSANVNDRHLRPTMTDELSLGVEHGVRADTAVSLTLTYRRIHDIPETRLQVVDASGALRLATRDDYILGDPATATLPDGRQVSVPVYVLNPGLTPNGRFYTNGDRTQRYLGGTVTFDKRLADNWELNGHVTYADWKWHIGPQFVHFADPTVLVRDDLGFATTNEVFALQSSSTNKADVLTGAKWTYNVFALYQVAPKRAWGFDIGANLTGRQGFPTAPYVNRSGPSGTRPVQLTSRIDQFRNDSIYILDGHLGKDLRFRDFGLTLMVDGFNLMNKHFVLQRQRNAGTTTPYVVTETLSPRILRLGAIVHFR